MSAEVRGPDPMGSGTPWQPATAGNDLKCPGNHHRQKGRQHQQHAFNQRRCFFGLETRPELVWDDWDLEREFTKTALLKNTLNKLQKLHVRSPVSRFFTILIPKIVALSPGTTLSIPVTFRPLTKCDYEDSIEFQGKDGSFQIRLRATIPCPALEVPDSVQLPICAVQQSSHTTFQFKNSSKLQTCFKWLCPAPFQLNPEQGLLRPGQECHIKVVFQPQEAMVYQQQAHCWFGEDEDKAEGCCTVLLQGLAKYPYLQLRSPTEKEEKQQGCSVLHFGSVAVGKSLQKHFVIANPLPVTASFSLSRLSGGLPLFGSEFRCDVSSGKVAPGGSLQATVTFSPDLVDTVSVEYLSVKCRGALNETILKLMGSCIGPKVSLSSSVLDFGCIKEGETVTQTVDLVNSSPAEAIYQWDIDCNGHSVFIIQPASGTIRPHSHITLKAVYRPTQPIAHHRRVACLILHKEPLFLDLIGTLHSELQKPAILKPEHLILYKLHWNRRQDALSAMQPDQNVPLDQHVLHSALEEESSHRLDSTIVSRTPMEEHLGCTDPLFSDSSSSHVSVVPSELVFNHKMSGSLSASSSQPVSIINHTRGKLSLVWTVAKDSAFSVSPSSCDLAPLKSTSFRVTYDPKQLNTLHGAQLECFGCYKMDHVGKQLLCPPWCVTVRVIGHSFQPGKEHFTPCCSLKPTQVVFPAVSALSYQTVLLQNGGDLPLTFCLDHSSGLALAESVSVNPHCGLVQPGRHQILTLRTTPTEDNPKQGFSLQLKLNEANQRKELKVVNVVEKPCVSLEGDGSLYFQPTIVGSQTQRTHHIRNLSCLPLRFQWSIPELDQDLISVEPDAGELHPNESAVQTWSFSPLAEKAYTLKPTLTFWPVQTDGCKKSHHTLNVVGVGSKGFIEAKKAVLDLEDTLIGSYQSIEIPLVNNSPCPVSFHLSVQQILQDEELIYDPETEPSALQLDCERGTITSRSTMLLRSTVRPNRRAQYLWKISYQTLNTSGCASSPRQPLCEVRAKGVFPTLQVTDVCSSGSVARLSKVHLWELLSLGSLNKHLLSNPSSAELTHRTPTRHSLRNYPSTFTNTMLDFNFGAAPMNSDPSNFVLMLHNPGPIPVDWAFLFPEDQQIETEYWAETGEFSSTELKQMKIQDNRVFNISPRMGTLQPGQQRAVHLSYSHFFAGTNRFPVVFKLSYGREILLNFQGVTLGRDRPFLLFSSNCHVFTSVTIGDCFPPKQVYELHNAGAVAVHYEVDRAVLSQLQMDNFNHPVLCCLNPEGEVPPGRTATVEWIFSPLESKMYHMDIPIYIDDGDSTLVRFEGCGVYSPALGSSNAFSCSETKAPVSSFKRVPFPGQVAFLSQDSVSLGDISVCSRSSRILFLTNVSQTDIVHYSWDLPQEKTQVVQITPHQGRLDPGECALCVLTFTSTDYPTIYQLDLICQVFQEAALTRYREALRSLEEERERQQNEFIITDKNLSEIQEDLVDKEPVAAPVRKGPPLRKYKTLPPICASSSCERVGSICTKVTKAEQRARRKTTKVQRQPEPPQPALLHLEVTARSHALPEYLTHFPDQFSKLSGRLQSVKHRKPETTCSSMSLSVSLPAPTHERDIVTHVLNSLLRSILDDSAFVDILVTLASKLHQSSQCSPVCPTSSGETKAESHEECNTVDGEGTAGCSGNAPPTQNTPHAHRVPDVMSEAILLNTFQNLMMEAVRGELVLTAHPRTVILPPVSARRMSRATADENDTPTSQRPSSVYQQSTFPHSESSDT
ncbi:hypothetical protein INR49_025197 [Caranx melampygus]|nr:hypothetical protein INR49_025197 [Caranx melampygus]